jgi:spore germination protein YaaH
LILSLAALVAATLAVTALGGAVSVSAAGAASSCKRVAPSHLTLTLAHGKPVAKLKWRAPRRGARGIAYRVLRDGRIVGQTRHRSMKVRVSIGKRHRFVIRRVLHGHAMRGCSLKKAVRMTTAAPGAPTGLTAADVTDTGVTLSWRAAGGAVRGYRILRDGKTVRQVAETSARVDNLFAARDYTLAVVAVDQMGRLSAPARVQVHTLEPSPSQGLAHAFLLASTGQSFKDFQAHYREIGTVYPTYYDCNTSTAALEGHDDPLITNFAKSRKVAILPRFNCQRTTVLNRILNEPELRAAWLDQITALVDQNGYDGVNLDFEAGAASDRGAYTQFVADLAARMHDRGKRLSVAVSAKLKDVPRHPRSTFFDYAGLSQNADTVFVMAWGIHWATSAPGAQDDLGWVRNVVSYIDTMPNRSKFVLGMQLYAMDWADNRAPGEQAETYEHAEAVARAQQAGATPTYDAAQDAMYFAYTGADGRSRQVWYTEAHTQATRIQMARDHGLGIGFWRLGREDQRLWDNPLLTPAG